MPIEPTPGSSEKRPQRHQMLAGEAPSWFVFFFSNKKPPFIQDFHGDFPMLRLMTLEDNIYIYVYVYIYICVYIYVYI